MLASIHACATCTDWTYLTVTQTWMVGEEEKSEELHADVVMTRAERQQIIDLCQQHGWASAT